MINLKIDDELANKLKIILLINENFLRIWLEHSVGDKGEGGGGN